MTTARTKKRRAQRQRAKVRPVSRRPPFRIPPMLITASVRQLSRSLQMARFISRNYQ